MLKKWISVVLLIAVVICLSGCQTIQGVGEDIKWVGEQDLINSD